MSLDDTLHALALLESELPGVKRSFIYPPDRRQALTDFPCWVNTYTLVDVLGWGELRIERYGITAQLFTRDADTSSASVQATEIGSAFLKAYDETHGELYAQTVGLDLRTLTPTLGIIEWAGQAYVGCQFLMDCDVSVPTDTPFADPFLEQLNAWTARQFPSWQYDPRTWAPTDVEPALYWHYVNLPHPSTVPLTLDFTYFEATLAARIAAPARTARTSATIALSLAIGKDSGVIALSPDCPMLELVEVNAWPQVEQPAEGQLSMTVRYAVPDETAGLDGPPFGTAVLTYADIEGSYGPRIAVDPSGRVPPPPFEPPVAVNIWRQLREAGIDWRALREAGLDWRTVRTMTIDDVLRRLGRFDQD